MAVALGLFQDVRLTWTPRPCADPAVAQVDHDGEGRQRLPVDRARASRAAGCYSLQVPDWTASDPQPASTVLVTIDVKH